MVEKKKILITGGLGFIGSRLTAHFLAKKDWTVIVSTRKNKEDLRDLHQDDLSYVNLSSMSEKEISNLC